MRLGRAWIILAGLVLAAGAATAQERLTLEPYPADARSSQPWQVVTNQDLGGRFYVELMPADQTLSDYRDIVAAASFPHVKTSAAEVLQGMQKQFGQQQPCEGLSVNAPRTSQEQGLTVAYAEAYCGQQQGQTFGVQIFYKAIAGADGVYVVSRDLRVPPSKVGGALSFEEGQQDQALALMKSVGAAKAWLANSVYLCGPSTKDARCSRPAPEGAHALVSGGELDALSRSVMYQDLVRKAVAALPPELTARCPGQAAGQSSILVLKPISFASNGMPVEGVWKQSLAQAKCPDGVTLNFLFTAQADERIRTLLLAPGDGIADARVQVDAFRRAVASVQALSPSCQALHVLNTRLDGFDHSRSPGPDPAPGAKVEIPWRETWTLGGCGGAWTVPMQFTPQGAATEVTAAGATPRS
jgi:hypothetical protein